MTDPTRLLDDPSIAASLRADLAQAKAAGIAGFDVAAGAASLNAAIAAEATTATATAASTGAGKGLVLGVLGVVSAGAIAWATLGSPEPEPEPETVAAVVATPAPPEPEPEPEPVVTPELADESVAPEEDLRDAIAEPLPEPTKARVHRSPASSEPKPAAPVVSDDYLREAKLIAEARRTMKHDPARALEILREAKSSFPRGLLLEERQALTILCLDALGRSSEARTRGRRFLDEHEGSPYADAVSQVLH